MYVCYERIFWHCACMFAHAYIRPVYVCMHVILWCTYMHTGMYAWTQCMYLYGWPEICMYSCIIPPGDLYSFFLFLKKKGSRWNANGLEPEAGSKHPAPGLSLVSGGCLTKLCLSCCSFCHTMKTKRQRTARGCINSMHTYVHNVSCMHVDIVSMYVCMYVLCKCVCVCFFSSVYLYATFLLLFLSISVFHVRW